MVLVWRQIHGQIPFRKKATNRKEKGRIINIKYLGPFSFYVSKFLNHFQLLSFVRPNAVLNREQAVSQSAKTLSGYQN
jgi:hypothetical protein